MVKKLMLVALIVVGGLFYGGCTAQPVYNVQNAQVSGKKTQAQVEQAIMKAGASLGWRMNKVKNGLIVGTIARRTHTAVIDVSYSASSYNISYKDSSDLNYDGVNIHKNYNSWVQNLDNAIQMMLY